MTEHATYADAGVVAAHTALVAQRLVGRPVKTRLADCGFAWSDDALRRIAAFGFDCAVRRGLVLQ